MKKLVCFVLSAVALIMLVSVLASCRTTDNNEDYGINSEYVPSTVAPFGTGNGAGFEDGIGVGDVGFENGGNNDANFKDFFPPIESGEPMTNEAGEIVTWGPEDGWSGWI